MVTDRTEEETSVGSEGQVACSCSVDKGCGCYAMGEVRWSTCGFLLLDEVQKGEMPRGKKAKTGAGHFPEQFEWLGTKGVQSSNRGKVAGLGRVTLTLSLS